MQLSIIIINYKSSQLVIDCIRSIYNQNSTLSYEIIVVDNNSEDGSREKIITLFPGVVWIDVNYNSGFARANNEGIRRSAGEVVLLLNPDTIVEDDAITKCYYHFANSEYSACGIQILNPDNTPQVSGLYAVKGGLNFLLQLPYAGSLLKLIGGKLKLSRPILPVAIGIVEVDWINGAFLMVKKTAIKKAGLLDEDFFLYAEEAEWCSRLKKTGKLCIYGGIHIIHLQAGVTLPAFQSEDKAYKNIFDKKGLQIMVSSFLRIRKQFGVAWFLFILLIFILDIPVFLTGVLVTLLTKGGYTFSDFFGYVKNIGKTILLSHRIIRNKPYFYKML